MSSWCSAISSSVESIPSLCSAFRRIRSSVSGLPGRSLEVEPCCRGIVMVRSGEGCAACCDRSLARRVSSRLPVELVGDPCVRGRAAARAALLLLLSLRAHEFPGSVAPRCCALYRSPPQYHGLAASRRRAARGRAGARDIAAAALQRPLPSECTKECTRDDDCEDDEMCCPYGCNTLCRKGTLPPHLHPISVIFCLILICGWVIACATSRAAAAAADNLNKLCNIMCLLDTHVLSRSSDLGGDFGPCLASRTTMSERALCTSPITCWLLSASIHWSTCASWRAPSTPWSASVRRRLPRSTSKQPPSSPCRAVSTIGAAPSRAAARPAGLARRVPREVGLGDDKPPLLPRPLLEEVGERAARRLRAPLQQVRARLPAVGRRVLLDRVGVVVVVVVVVVVRLGPPQLAELALESSSPSVSDSAARGSQSSRAAPPPPPRRRRRPPSPPPSPPPPCARRRARSPRSRPCSTCSFFSTCWA